MEGQGNRERQNPAENEDVSILSIRANINIFTQIATTQQQSDFQPENAHNPQAPPPPPSPNPQQPLTLQERRIRRIIERGNPDMQNPPPPLLTLPSPSPLLSAPQQQQLQGFQRPPQRAVRGVRTRQAQLVYPTVADALTDEFLHSVAVSHGVQLNHEHVYFQMIREIFAHYLTQAVVRVGEASRRGNNQITDDNQSINPTCSTEGKPKTNAKRRPDQDDDENEGNGKGRNTRNPISIN